MKTKIVLGTVYEDKWGDKRVPIIIKEGDENKNYVVYILNRKADGCYIYNPYSGMVSEKEFILKWTPTKEMIALPKIKKIKDIIYKADESWAELLMVSMLGINKVLK